MTGVLTKCEGVDLKQRNRVRPTAVRAGRDRICEVGVDKPWKTWDTYARRRVRKLKFIVWYRRPRRCPVQVVD